MQTQMLVRLVVGLGMTAIVGLLALRRVGWLAKLTLSGQPATGRTDDVGGRVWTEVSEVFGQRRLLKWSIPGLAHFFTMWGFFILLTVYIEAYGLLFQSELPHPDHRAMGRAGLLAGLLRHRCLPRASPPSRSSVSLRSPTRDRPLVAVLWLTYRRRLADPVHDLQRHLDLRAGSRVRGQQRHAPLRQGRVPVASYSARSCSRSATPATRFWRQWRCFCTSASCSRS